MTNLTYAIAQVLAMEYVRNMNSGRWRWDFMSGEVRGIPEGRVLRITVEYLDVAEHVWSKSAVVVTPVAVAT
jgi:hypothetical protein